MKERENIESVKHMIEAFTQGRIQEMLQMFSEDLDFKHPMPQSIWPWAGNRSGWQGLAEFFAGLTKTIEYEQFEPREFIAQEDSVAVVLFERGCVRATSVAFDNLYVLCFKFAQSKVTQIKVFEDTAPIIAALQGYRKSARMNSGL
jgi:ketosteroid isomerase-like protein